MSGLFKKPFSVRSSNPLGGKALKQFKKLLLKLFPSLSDDDLKALFPKKAPVVVEKLDKHMLVYVCEGDPLFFDVTNGKNQILPTVYALWKLPHLLLPLYVHSPVSKYIIRGADVMLPGVTRRQELADVARKEPRCVLAAGNPAPVAVGIMGVSTADLVSGGFQGKGMEVVHHYGDLLWKHGTKSVPNESFFKDKVLPLAGFELEVDDNEEEDEEEEDRGSSHVQAHIHALKDASTVLSGWRCDGCLRAGRSAAMGRWRCVEGCDYDLCNRCRDAVMSRAGQGAEDGATRADMDGSGELGVEASIASLTLGDDAEDKVQEGEQGADEGVDDREMEIEEEAEAEEEEEEEEDHVSPERMDEMLNVCLVLALKIKLPSYSDLPVDASQLYQLMEECNASSTRIDVKRSSYRKLSKFLKDCTKRGIIRTKAIKGVIQILEVARDHDEFATVQVDKKLLKTLKKKQEMQQQQQQEASTEQADSSQVGTESGRPTLVVDVRYKVSPRVATLFDGQPKDRLYTGKELDALLVEYYQNHSLLKGKKWVNVDATLYHALFFSKKGNDKRRHDQARKTDVAGRLREHMHRLIAIAPDGDLSSAVYKQSKPQVMVCVEKERWALVTKVGNLELFGIDPAGFAKTARKAFACGVTVQQREGARNKKLKAVVLKGDHGKKMARHLHDAHGVPLEFVADRKF